MWAAGCCLAELLVGERLREPIWDDAPEVTQRRDALLAAAGQRCAGPLIGESSRRIAPPRPSAKARFGLFGI